MFLVQCLGSKRFRSMENLLVTCIGYEYRRLLSYRGINNGRISRIVIYVDSHTAKCRHLICEIIKSRVILPVEDLMLVVSRKGREKGARTALVHNLPPTLLQNVMKQIDKLE